MSTGVSVGVGLESIIVGGRSAGGASFPPAFDPVLYGVDSADDRLETVNLDTGVVTAVGPRGFGAGITFPSAATWDSRRNALYMVNAFQRVLYSVNTDTGIATALIRNLPDILISTAYDQNDDIIHMFGDTSPQGYFQYSFATGTITQISNLNTQVHGAVFNPKTNTLFGARPRVRSGTGGIGHLVTINRMTGAWERVGTSNDYGNPALRDQRSLALNLETDTMYIASEVPGQLQVIDPDTSLVGNIITNHRFSGLTFANRLIPLNSFSDSFSNSFN